jgi:hypothetical protein
MCLQAHPRQQKAMQEPFQGPLGEYLLQDLQLELLVLEEAVLLRGLSIRTDLHFYLHEEDRIWLKQVHRHRQISLQCQHPPIFSSNSNNTFRNLRQHHLSRHDDQVDQCKRLDERRSHKARVLASQCLHMARPRVRHRPPPLSSTRVDRLHKLPHRTIPGRHLLLRCSREVECSFLGPRDPLKVRTALPLLRLKAALSSRAVQAVQGKLQPQSPFKSLQ